VASLEVKEAWRLFSGAPYCRRFEIPVRHNDPNQSLVFVVFFAITKAKAPGFAGQH
jgi:hypothetical protein